MRCLAILLLVGGLWAADAPVFSDQEWTTSQKPASQPAAETPGWGSIATLGFGLVLVVGAAIGLGWAAKRLNARRLLGGRGRNLELIESIQLAPRRSLALVRLGGQWLVVGVGEKELTHIASMAAPPEPVAAVAPTGPAPTPVPPADPTASPFAGELARLVAGAKESRL